MNTTAASCDLPAEKTAYHKWLLGLVLVTVIALGWKYPFVGFIVPAAMGAGIAGGIFKGRWICGNACPRGSFLDSWFNLISGSRKTPGIFKNKVFRWSILSVLMGSMIYLLSQNPTDVNHWGIVFWQMCTVTTVIAFVLGVRYSSRSWCSICPVGTMAAPLGKEKHLLQVSQACEACGKCEQSCPMQLEISSYRHTGKSKEADCIKCSKCITACPRSDVLSWPAQKAA